MRRLPIALFALVSVAGCGYVLDDDAPPITLVGEPPPRASLQQFNRTPARGFGYLLGADNKYWLVLYEVGSSAPRAVRVDDTTYEETLEADDLQLRWRYSYMVGRYQDGKSVDNGICPVASSPLSGKKAKVLTIHSVNAAANPKDPDVKYCFPADEPYQLFVEGGDDFFIWWPKKSTTKTVDFYRRRQGKICTIAVPPNISPTDPTSNGRWAFSGDANSVLLRDSTGAITLIDTNCVKPNVSLGVRPNFSFDLGNGNLFALGDDGMRLVPLTGAGPDKVLVADACDPAAVWFTSKQKEDKTYVTIVYYKLKGDSHIRKVPLDASSPSTLAEGDENGAVRVLGWAPVKPMMDPQIIYSRETAAKFANGAGDGWWGKWNFMERGDWVSFSRDAKKLRWREHSAQPSGVGDLLAIDLPDHPETSPPATFTPLHLARNVSQYQEIDDGRILTVENHAFVGTQSRIVAIDEKAHTAQWVCEAANNFNGLPGTPDLLVELVTSAPGAFDLVRVPIPKPLHPPADMTPTDK